MSPKRRSQVTSLQQDLQPVASSSAFTVEQLAAPSLETTALGQLRVALLPALRNALESSSSSPPDAVEQVWAGLPAVEGDAKDARPLIVERALETLAVERANGSMDLLQRALDIIIAHDEKGLCTDTTFFNALELVLEGQSVEQAEQTFAYLERVRGRVIRDMSPQRGRGPILLRACNDLRRRLSKVTHLELYGRIGLLLAGCFGATDRSSINIRGDYNLDNVTAFEPPPKEPSPVVISEDTVEDGPKDEPAMDVDALPSEEGEASTSKLLKPAKDEPAPPKSPTEDFYSTFWSLQRFFNNPPSLFDTEASPEVLISPPAALKASTPNLKSLRHALVRVFETFNAATKKEKAVTGAEAKGKGAIKAHQTASEIKSEYFFPKFLTSRTLLDLQITDIHFRRQVLVQIAITLQFLMGLAPLERDKLLSVSRRVTGKDSLNSSIKANMVLPEDDHKWVDQAMKRCLIELRSTPPDGDVFVKSVQLILEREQNWVLWKISTMCRSFERPPVDTALFAKAEAAQKKLQQPFKPYEHALGTATLSRLWAIDTSLDDFEKASVTSFAEYHERSKAVDVEIEERKEALKAKGMVMPGQLAEDMELQYLQARKSSAEWRGLRRALADQGGLAAAMTGEPTLDNVAGRLENLRKSLAKKRAATVKVEEKTASSSPAIEDVNGVKAEDAMAVDTPPVGVPLSVEMEEDGKDDNEGSAEVNDEDEHVEENDALDAELEQAESAAGTAELPTVISEDDPGGTASQPIELNSSQPGEDAPSDILAGTSEAPSENGDAQLPVVTPSEGATPAALSESGDAQPLNIKRLRDEESEASEPSPKRAKSVAEDEV